MAVVAVVLPPALVHNSRVEFFNVPEDRLRPKSTLKIPKGMYLILYWNELCVPFLKIIQSQTFAIIVILFRLSMFYALPCPI